MEYQQQRQQVADAGRRLLDEGLVARTWGNVSCRTGADTFVITPSGLGYEHMTAADVVPFCMTDGSFTGARKPSSEKGVHTAMYRRFPDADFVIHTHQTYATALGLAGFGGIALSAEETDALGGLALASYGMPGTKKLVRAVEHAAAPGAHTVLMAHHGALVAGRNADEAFARVQLLESVCRRACRGQECAVTGDEKALAAITAQAAAAYGHAESVADAAVLATATLSVSVPAQLDDTAQMIGRKLITVAPENAVAALKTRDAVLVRGLGAVCRANTSSDAHALCLLVEKTCVSFLHARACGERATLSLFDTAVMRRVYLTKYSKKIGG